MAFVNESPRFDLANPAPFEAWARDEDYIFSSVQIFNDDFSACRADLCDHYAGMTMLGAHAAIRIVAPLALELPSKP